MCEQGPITKTFGGSQWDVFGCNDGHSIVATAKEGNSAAPFYFLLHLKDGQFRISGEGTGNQAATGLAFEELKNLTLPQLNALHAATGK